MLIFLECWIFFPQQIYFANGFWLCLALVQGQSLYCECQRARVTAEVGGGRQRLLPELQGPPWKKAGPQLASRASVLPSASSAEKVETVIS